MVIGCSIRLVLSSLLVCSLWGQSGALRLLKDKDVHHENSSWLQQDLPGEGNELSIGPFPMLNVSGSYKGIWRTQNPENGSVRFPDFQNSMGTFVVELSSSTTEIHGVHYVQGHILLWDGMYVKGNDPQLLQMRMEGVYVWPFRQLRMVLSSASEADFLKVDDSFPSNPYHLLGIFSLQVLQESPRSHPHTRKRNGAVMEMSKTCKVHLSTQIVSAIADDHHAYQMRGSIESPMIEDEGECFPSIAINATSVNVEAYYTKAVNYTLMVTFISFLQVLFLIRQMEHSSTQSGAAKVSLLMIGQQAIMDAYLCLLHLTAGILVESLFNAFATAAFFKFVIFSIFEMRYLLAIWKARRPATSGEGWEAMRRELSVLYSRFYGFLLGGILIMYELHSMLRYILVVFYAFWIPQIVANVARDSRKPLHPHYILGITLTRLAIPLYAFGCPRNFMRIEVDVGWCIGISSFLLLQAFFLLLQHYLGSRWFIPRKFLPEKYSYFRRIDRTALQIGLNGDNMVVDCVICMAAVDIGQRSSDCMVTPCDHVFHSGCLQRWMDIKMECPTCRRSLPPL
ncbi:transmembrane E3 ubiquitin-protein ligase 1 [Selaginella moellendorffii]|uniref:transmembrane E3 ubiquitin-protein ligase 1 n=1 Tax=Selaginella moellendorffii TaxID=88036 RepID=UPI000D1D0EF2|nr:transmembrane E3 ubiquitin-protein ligase 1 [Selaginella moellendorffii]|eukprot:XP_024532225.1 transmembrane E3 ubiquitin-protein ligase 1 [Selaginella moellendorffii]